MTARQGLPGSAAVTVLLQFKQRTAGLLLEAWVGNTRTGQGASSTSWVLTPPIGDRAFLKRPLTVLVTTSRSVDWSSQNSHI